MSYQIFTKQSTADELEDMFTKLGHAPYAISTLPYETIQLYADSHGMVVKLRRLKDGRVKVAYIKQAAPQPKVGDKS